jgi:hypothetical protein
MQGISLETPVLPANNRSSVTNIYNAVITAMLNNANRILVAVNGSEGNRDTLVAAVNALHSLVANCMQYSLHGCVIYALKKGQTELAETVMKHPLLKVILLYLFAGGHTSGVYLDWTIKVVVTPIGFMKLRRMIDYKITHHLVLSDPAVDISAGDSKIEVSDMTKSKKAAEDGEEEDAY